MGRCLAKIAKGFLGCNVVLAGAYDKAIVEYNFLNLKMVRELIVNLILKQVHKASGSTYTWRKESQYNEQGEKNLVPCATIGEIANMPSFFRCYSWMLCLSFGLELNDCEWTVIIAAHADEVSGRSGKWDA